MPKKSRRIRQRQPWPREIAGLVVEMKGRQEIIADALIKCQKLTRHKNKQPILKLYVPRIKQAVEDIDAAASTIYDFGVRWRDENQPYGGTVPIWIRIIDELLEGTEEEISVLVALNRLAGDLEMLLSNDDRWISAKNEIGLAIKDAEHIKYLLEQVPLKKRSNPTGYRLQIPNVNKPVERAKRSKRS